MRSALEVVRKRLNAACVTDTSHGLLLDMYSNRQNYDAQGEGCHGQRGGVVVICDKEDLLLQPYVPGELG